MAVLCDGEQPVVVGLPAHVHWSPSLQCVHHCQLPAGDEPKDWTTSQEVNAAALYQGCVILSALSNFCLEWSGC